MRIDVAGIRAPPLKQTAIQQNILPRTLNVMARTGDSLVRTPEMQTNCHALSSMLWSCAGKSLHRAPLPFKSHGNQDSDAKRLKLAASQRLLWRCRKIQIQFSLAIKLQC